MHCHINLLLYKENEYDERTEAEADADNKSVRSVAEELSRNIGGPPSVPAYVIESQVGELEATDQLVGSVEDRVQERTPALEEPPAVEPPALHDLVLEGDVQKEAEHVQESVDI